MHPKLRPIQPLPLNHAGEEGFVLRDPLALSEQALFLPRKLAPILTLCDGTRDLEGLRASLMIRFGVQVPVEMLARLISQLDQAYLLNNERFVQAYNAGTAAYRKPPFRAAMLAGKSYPADPEQLAALFTRFEADLLPDERASEFDAEVRGAVCPHIDYRRGGRVYAGLWRRAAEAARQAELIVVLGTDHNSSNLLTLTRQNYATPWGALPTSRPVVDALAQAIGEKEAFEHELYHRVEHSIELALVWLHAILGDHTPELVPILTGSFMEFINNNRPPDSHEKLAALIETLKKISAQKRTLIIAAADLAHVGPAFGGQALDFITQAKLRSDDAQLLEAVCEGDAESFFGQIQAERDRRNICGLPPIYLTMQILGPTHGQITGYEICRADQANTSSVSVAGVLLW